MERFRHYYRSLSVLMVDIVTSRASTTGSVMRLERGDQLSPTSAFAASASRTSSAVGGEEFAVLLPETTLSRARLVAERIRKRVEGH